MTSRPGPGDPVLPARPRAAAAARRARRARLDLGRHRRGPRGLPPLRRRAALRGAPDGDHDDAADPGRRPARRRARPSEDVGTVWFGAAAPLGLLGPALRRAGAGRVLASTHGHEVGWSMLPGSRQALGRIGRAADVVTTVSRLHPRPDRRRPRTGRRARAAAPGHRHHPLPARRRARAPPIRRRHGLGERPLVACVSRLVRRKGQDVLIAALPAHPRGRARRGADDRGRRPGPRPAAAPGPAARRRRRRGLHRSDGRRRGPRPPRRRPTSSPCPAARWPGGSTSRGWASSLLEASASGRARRRRALGRRAGDRPPGRDRSARRRPRRRRRRRDRRRPARRPRPAPRRWARRAGAGCARTGPGTARAARLRTLAAATGPLPTGRAHRSSELPFARASAGSARVDRLDVGGALLGDDVALELQGGRELAARPRRSRRRGSGTGGSPRPSTRPGWRRRRPPGSRRAGPRPRPARRRRRARPCRARSPSRAGPRRRG